MKKSFVLAVGISAVCSAFSADITYIGAGESQGSAVASALTNATNWSDSSMPADGDYLLAKGYKAYVGWDGSDFICNSLTLGSSKWDAGAGAIELKTANATYHCCNLILKQGYIYTKCTGGTATFTGNIEISDALGISVPLRFLTNGGYNQQNIIAATIKGNGAFLYQKTSNRDSDYAPLTVSGDLSGYTGTFTIGGADNDNPKAYFKDTTCGGTIKMNGVTGLYVKDSSGTTHYGCLTTSGLNLQSTGSTVYFGFNATTSATFNVRQTLTLPETGSITFRYSGYALSTTYNTTRVRHPILIAPVGQIDLDKINLTNVDEYLLMAGAVHWELAENEQGDGYDILYLVQEKYRYQVTKDDWNDCALTKTFSHWSGSPSGIEEGMIYIDKDKGLQMATCTFSNRLVIGGNVAAAFYAHPGSVFEAADLICYSPMFINMNQNKAQINGKMKICGTGYVTVKVGQNQTDTIGADITGSGGLAFTCTTDTDRRGAIKLTGDNSGFTGKIKIADTSVSTGTNVEVNVSASANLGGNPADFVFDGLSIGQGGRLYVGGDVEIGANRGLYCSVSSDNPNGGVNVADGKTLTVQSRLTMDGVLRKMGPGMLVLGGPKPKFTENETDVPEEGLNRLAVIAGGLKISSAEAINGLEVVLPEGGKLTLDADTDDADLKTRGVVNTDWTKPFDLTACGGKLTIDVEGVTPGEESEFAICTVSSEAAAALDGNILLPKVRQLKASVLKVENDDGSVTFKANYENTGLILLFR